ncbi:MAG TPA: hypothetical protein VH413_00570 [Verrucomicrobiae bacterium]|jgi:hypothetical protein|nr:hypothetical protein [Verrucomicrobiae bacterium]
MKSLILIVSYLWKDTCSRWFEQPGSPLARWFVTAMLVAVATVMLISLNLLERSLRERLEHFGLNTLLVRETVSPVDQDLLVSERMNRMAELSRYGSFLRLRQLYVRGQTEWRNDLAVFSYSTTTLGPITNLLSLETPLICLSESLPENTLVEVTVNHRRGLAMVRRPNDFLRPLALENILIVPQDWLTEEQRMGYVDTLIFQRREDAPPMAQTVEAVQILFSMEQLTPQIQSPLELIRAWESLKERQRQWRAGLAIGLGFTLALVFGAIAVLEFRQNLYVTALLRSFGVPARWLWFRQWQESAFIANLAALTVIGLLYFCHPMIFAALGFPPSVIQFDGTNPYCSLEIGMLLLCVNAGAFLSSIPVAAGLRNPIGKVLA